MRKFSAVVAAVVISLGCSSAMAATFTALTSDDNQVATAANTPKTITMGGDATPGYKVKDGKITIVAAGDYVVIATAQVGGSAAGNVYMWPKVNGKDVPDSNSIQYVSSPQFTAVLVAAGEMSFKAGDVLEFDYAASAPGLGLIASKPAGMPTVPSMIFTMYKLP